MAGVAEVEIAVSIDFKIKLLFFDNKLYICY